MQTQGHSDYQEIPLSTIKALVLSIFLLIGSSALAEGPIDACYYKADFYYKLAGLRDNGANKVDVEQYIKNVVVEDNLPLSFLDSYIEAIQYVWAVNSSPEQIAAGVFKECLVPEKRA